MLFLFRAPANLIMQRKQQTFINKDMRQSLFRAEDMQRIQVVSSGLKVDLQSTMMVSIVPNVNF